MRYKRWIPFLMIAILLTGIIWKVTREPPPEIPRFPTIKGEVHGIDRIIFFAFLPFPDQRQIMLFTDLQKAKYGNLKGGFEIHFFNDFEKTPTAYPITEAQMKHLCAVYGYNHKTGLDQLSWTIPPKKAATDKHYSPE